MEHMGAVRKYPVELREQAVRLVREWRGARGRSDGGIKEVAEQLGVHSESVRNWVRQSEIDAGNRPGLSTDDKARIAELERENFELRRANEILKSAAVFFGAELDRRPKR
jgi:transposase